MNRTPGVGVYQVLNEPEVFHGIGPDESVNSFLKPAWEVIKEIRPNVPVVSAAPANTSGWRLYFYNMTEAGDDRYCDYHAKLWHPGVEALVGDFLARTRPIVVLVHQGSRLTGNLG